MQLASDAIKAAALDNKQFVQTVCHLQGTRYPNSLGADSIGD